MSKKLKLFKLPIMSRLKLKLPLKIQAAIGCLRGDAVIMNVHFTQPVEAIDDQMQTLYLSGVIFEKGCSWISKSEWVHRNSRGRNIHDITKTYTWNAGGQARQFISRPDLDFDWRN